jgi:hypothetical protein
MICTTGTITITITITTTTIPAAVAADFIPPPPSPPSPTQQKIKTCGLYRKKITLPDEGILDGDAVVDAFLVPVHNAHEALLQRCGKKTEK